MSLFVLAVFLCFAVTSWGHGFEDHIDASGVPDHVRFRVLRDEDLPEQRSKNGSDIHHYYTIIKEHVTQQKLHDLAHKHITGYASAKPFPHMVASDIFPQEVLEAANLEIPDKPQNLDGCIAGAGCYNNKVKEKAKNAWFKQETMGPATQAIFTFMKSPSFVHFLERVTGIEEIVPDGFLAGAGIHQTLSGGFLAVHADFNRDPSKGLHRRVNVFLYLNPDWKEEYGGHLELWTRDLQRCEARVSPDLGKLVVFSSTDFSYHGHQTPLSCPENRSRRSLAVYYYTQTRPASECLNDDCEGTRHSTLWQTTVCPSCSDDQKCYQPTA